ncbi:type II secretion system minor pseudopilin GspI [Pseudomonas sp. TH05]|uniref:type II secretion system minor pseudopilin GspI n=1 Tax=unclassified Pseudomonas TaxID=196821 RepID=UPI00099783AD|nr:MULTISPECIES: type II secretion system minor pseudopilin GspI [unclassified Pseudomonas]MBK5539742.1 type II secretion system minor pseudopilin GspI [Pseudomonas sp. TH07]MBK5554717.1 type II secretion system minor pseudopilin GspI [Pseudomonas sp. TH05]OOV89558.1 type II secretion system protein GspI [Pseudomonas sp. MF4836]
MKRCEGFTLLEVMVALSIFATLSVALYSAAQHIAGNSAGLAERSLAHWLADNRMNELRAGMRSLATGQEQDRLDFGGRQWLLDSRVASAPDPSLRKVSLEVSVVGSKPVRRALLSGFIEARP